MSRPLRRISKNDWLTPNCMIADCKTEVDKEFKCKACKVSNICRNHYMASKICCVCSYGQDDYFKSSKPVPMDQTFASGKTSQETSSKTSMKRSSQPS